jgi:hypothetical protein
MNCPDAFPVTATPPGQSAENVPAIEVAVWLVMLHMKLPQDDGDGSAADCTAQSPSIGLDEPPLVVDPDAVGPTGLLECPYVHAENAVAATSAAGRSHLCLLIPSAIRTGSLGKAACTGPITQASPLERFRQTDVPKPLITLRESAERR